MQEFLEAVERLNTKNLLNLLVVSCITSAFDYFSGFPHKFPYVFPLTNHKNTMMLSKAIIYSRSNAYLENILTLNNLAFVFNKLSTAGDRMDIIHDETIDVETKLEKIMSSFFCSQLRFTQNNLQPRVSIKYALFYKLPHRLETTLREKHKSNYVNIPSVMANQLGIDLPTYFAFALLLLLGYKDRYDKYLDPDDEIKKEIEKLVDDEKALNKAKERYLYSIIQHIDKVGNNFVFRSEYFKNFTKDEVDTFLSLTSLEIKGLRQINNEPAFQLGHISDRLSPLERYPIVKLNPSEHIVPNFRYYDLAITELLRWVFQEIYQRNEFNEVLGTVLEHFILEILIEHFPQVLIIPEKTYKKKSSNYKGPDITLIEDDKLLVVEINSKHVSLQTRLAQDSESLILDLKSAFDALIRLKDEKIPDLYSGLDAYNKYQDRINITKENKPICIIVIGEGVHSLQEYLNIYCKKNKSFFLNTFEFPACFIDVTNFCEALDVAKKNNISLYSLFHEYWENGKNLTPKKYAAEEFGGREINWNISVLSKYWDEVMKHAKLRLGVDNK